jgi:hypothetical protein
MNSVQSREIFASVLHSTAVSRHDMAEMRSVIFETGLANRAEAEALLALDRGVCAQMPGWGAFFVEALSDFVLWQSRPTGRITESDLDWLLGCLGDRRSVNAAALLAALTRAAQEPPARLKAAVERLGG